MKNSSTLKTLFARELERHSRVDYDTLYRTNSCETLKTFWTSNRYSCEFLSDDGFPVPLFAVEFSRTAGGGQLLATCDEDGYVTLIDISKSSSFGTHERGWCSANFRRSIARNGEQFTNLHTSDAPIVSFQVHKNAIFSLCWLGLQDQWIATASGDQKVKIFDINKQIILHTLMGHSGSVKAVKEKHLTDGKVLATASRDGNVMIWDTRCQAFSSPETSELAQRPVLILKDIHRREIDVTCKRQRVTKRPRYSLHPKSNSIKPNIPHGVTSLAFAPFDDSFFLYTSGAVDGAVKLWDLRRATLKQFPGEPLSTIYPGCQEGLTDRPHGISSLDITAEGRKLCVSSTDSKIYLYKTGLLDRGSFVNLSGHTSSSFYIKACFSPDGEFVLSGSADSYAYIWDVKQFGSRRFKAQLPLLRLPAHNNEVTDVAWCRTDVTKITTAGDDCHVRLWQTRKRYDECKSLCESQYLQAECAPQEIQEEPNLSVNSDRETTQSLLTSRSGNTNTLFSYFDKPIPRYCAALH